MIYVPRHNGRLESGTPSATQLVIKGEDPEFELRWADSRAYPEDVFLFFMGHHYHPMVIPV